MKASRATARQAAALEAVDESLKEMNARLKRLEAKVGKLMSLLEPPKSKTPSVSKDK